MVTHYINGQVHWNKFFRQCCSTTIHRVLSVPMDEEHKSIIIDAFTKMHATPGYGETLSGERYINSAVFESQEDLLYFRLKFN